MGNTLKSTLFLFFGIYLIYKSATFDFGLLKAFVFAVGVLDLFVFVDRVSNKEGGN